VIARFEDFWAARWHEPLYLAEICAAIGVSERTLRACCQDHLGMSPKRYLLLRRMANAARKLIGEHDGYRSRYALRVPAIRPARGCIPVAVRRSAIGDARPRTGARELTDDAKTIGTPTPGFLARECASFMNHPYPAPIRNLDRHRELNRNPDRRRAWSLLLWRRAGRALIENFIAVSGRHHSASSTPSRI